jgi:hypothetical protein
MGTRVVYGTDAFCAFCAFCAFVQRPALARVDDAALTAAMGNIVAATGHARPRPHLRCCCVRLAALADRPAASATAGLALTAAAHQHETPPNARALQRVWDHISVPRAILQGWPSPRGA